MAEDQKEFLIQIGVLLWKKNLLIRFAMLSNTFYSNRKTLILHLLIIARQSLKIRSVEQRKPSEMHLPLEFSILESGRPVKKAQKQSKA